MKITNIVAVLAFSLLGACMTAEPQMTPLELQSMQTREYSTNKDTVFASTMSVLQDLGYTVTSADKDTGLIAAESATGSSLGYAIFTGNTLTNQTRATAYIERIKSKTVVRLNFVTKQETSSGWGQTNRSDKPILDVTIYRNAFERIENAIFIRRN